MAVNKVELADGTSLIDITDSTVEASDVAAGKVFYTAAGVRTVGTAQSSSPLDAWPIGSIYQSMNSTEPSVLFGGTWERIKGRFILSAADDADIGTEPDYSICYQTAGATGGSERVTLSVNQIPAHTHGSKTLTGSFTARRAGTSGATNMVGGGDGIVSRTDKGGSSAWGTQASTTSSSCKPDLIEIDATHTHSSVGGGQSHNNMPPYIAAYAWVRTA